MLPVTHRKKIFRLSGFMLLCYALSLNTNAFGATTTTTMAVSATILSVCGVAATPLAFLNYSATDVLPNDISATVTVTCTSGVSYTIALDKGGGGASATFANRLMQSGANTLIYTIYKDSNHTTLWGDGTGSTQTVSGTAGLSPQTYTAYGRITAGQQSAAGTYTDTVTVTVTY